MPTPAEERAAADKASAEKRAATTGAQAVADAVKRVADAAVAEASKSSVKAPGDFIFTGTLGGRFDIHGSGFGANGTVKVGGVQVHTVGWSANHIEGRLPSGVSSGEVVVQIDENTSQRGYFKA